MPGKKERRAHVSRGMHNTIIGGRALSQKELAGALSQELVSQGYAQSTDDDADVSVWLGDGVARGWLALQMTASAGKALAARVAARLERDMDVFCITMLKDFECTLEHCVVDVSATFKSGDVASELEAEAAGNWRTYCDAKPHVLPMVLRDLALARLASEPDLAQGPSEGVELHFKAQGLTGDARVDGLITKARSADSVEFRVMAGRQCMRLGQADGSKTTLFIEESDEEILRKALTSTP